MGEITEREVRDGGDTFKVDPAWTHHPWTLWIGEISQHEVSHCLDEHIHTAIYKIDNQ